MSAQQQEKDRIRAKLSESDREFMDAMKAIFPNCRLKAIHFNDGEKIGRLEDG